MAANERTPAKGMRQMNIFYLPKNVNVDQAKKTWLEQEKKPGRRAEDYSYVHDEFRLVRAYEQSVHGIITRTLVPTTIIMWSFSDISCSSQALRDALESVKGRGVSLRILNPRLTLDPDSAEFSTLFSVVAFFETRKEAEAEDKVNAATDERHHKFRPVVVNPPIPERTQDAIREDKLLGMSMREIARKYELSLGCVGKYAKGIKSPKDIEREAERAKRKSERHWTVDDVKNWPIVQPSILFNSLREFIRNQRTPTTKRHYAEDLELFLRFASEKSGGAPLEEIEEITTELGQDYLYLLKSRNLSLSTQLRYMRTVKNFLKYCHAMGYTRRNAWAGIRLPADNQGSEIKTEPLTRDELREVLNLAIERATAPQAYTRKAKANRNFVALYLLASVGPRISSLLNLQIKDAHITQDQRVMLRLERKGDGEQRLTIDDRSGRILMNFLDEYHKDSLPEDYIFFSDILVKKIPITRDGFTSMLRRLLYDLGIERDITSHSFRTSFASLMFEDGASIREIQVRLGHTNINQTAKYIKFSKPHKDPSFLGGLSENLHQFIAR
jgi:integrase/recombinase XerD